MRPPRPARLAMPAATSAGNSPSTLYKVLSVAGLLVFGALNTLTSKIQFTLRSVGTQDADAHHAKLFEKPIWTTFTMFLAMSIVLVVHWVTERLQRQKHGTGSMARGLLEEDRSLDGEVVSEAKAFWLIGVPAAFDLIATALMLGGLVFMSASIYQMLRGSIIIFGAIISATVFHKPLRAHQWLGVLVCVVGVTMVGASSVLNTDSGAEDPGKKVTFSQSLLGIFLVISAQAAQAAQVVVEEKLMKGVKLPPLMIVGYEGVWGIIWCLAVVFPLCMALPGHDGGRLEDTWDTIAMVRNNRALLCLIILYLFSCSTFNVASVSVTNAFNAIHRTMFEASRTSVIWAFGLLVHYFVNPSAAFGEAWLPYSYLELVGFFVLITGQALYGEVLRLPCFTYALPALIASPHSPH